MSYVAIITPIKMEEGLTIEAYYDGLSTVDARVPKSVEKGEIFSGNVVAYMNNIYIYIYIYIYICIHIFFFSRPIFPSLHWR